MQRIRQATLATVPEGMVLTAFREWEDASLPWIWVDGDTLSIPVLVRSVPVSGGEGQLYAFYAVEMPFKGRVFDSYQDACCKCYRELRRYFYGPVDFENGLRDDNLWTRHRLAVKAAFPKFPGEVQQSIVRYNSLKESFWRAVDSALSTIGKTRGDMPRTFTGEYMLAYAQENGMDPTLVSQMTLFVETLSLNLLHNGRNWAELFM